MRHSKSRAKHLEVLERRQYVFRLRVTGASFVRIAELMQQNPTWRGRLPKYYRDSEVYKDVMAEVQRRRAELSEDVEAVRQQELDLLGQMQLAIVQRALGTPANLTAGLPAVPADLDAQRMLLNIMERRARYLPGVNAPVAVSPVTPDGTEPYLPTSSSPETFFAELAVLFQQLAPEHNATLPEPLTGMSNGHSTSYP